MTPARSVTKPCGAGMAGSGAARARTANAASSALQRRLRIGHEGVDRDHEALDLREICRELAAQRPSIDSPPAPPVLEQAPHGGGRPGEGLPRGAHRL